MSKRYQVVEEAISGHGCCFDATIIDTSRRHPIYKDQFETVCEVVEIEDANHICELLNAADDAAVIEPKEVH
ncbi:hypothetical protein [Serratia phage SMP]|uniref:Uncharacterized protein n=1 Tax=Serratia phage SMP TaxID=2982904 RepID=A0A9E8G0V0_9CAUD|nr:hypothetical protein [Serratia phage SMP]